MAKLLSPKLSWDLANPLWASSLNPVLSNPLNNINLIQNIPLIIGKNIINHKLGQMMQGWFVVDVQGIATLYRSAPLNDLTLTLTSSAVVTISLGVF